MCIAKKLLEAVDIKARYDELVIFIENEAEILKITHEIQEKVKANVDKIKRNIFCVNR